MIAAVSLRLLYLIFQQVLGLVLLMGGRPPPRTLSCSSCGMKSRCSAAPSRDRALGWADRAVLVGLIRRLPQALRGHRRLPWLAASDVCQVYASTSVFFWLIASIGVTGPATSSDRAT